MKKFFIIVFSMTIIMVFATGALASFAQGIVNPARFFVVDTTGDNSVKLDITPVLGSGILKYSFDKITWTIPAGSSAIFSGLDAYGGERLVYWMLDLDKDAFLKFSGERTGGYGNVLMVWSTDPSYEIKLVTPENCDAVNPVPIGSSALLLGSSIFGLMGFGLWRKNKILGNE